METVFLPSVEKKKIFMPYLMNHTVPFFFFFKLSFILKFYMIKKVKILIYYENFVGVSNVGYT